MSFTSHNDYSSHPTIQQIDRTVVRKFNLRVFVKWSQAFEVSLIETFTLVSLVVFEFLSSIFKYSKPCHSFIYNHLLWFKSLLMWWWGLVGGTRSLNLWFFFNYCERIWLDPLSSFTFFINWSTDSDSLVCFSDVL